MAETKVLTLSDLSDGEIEMLKLSPTAKFADDGKTVEVPKLPDDDVDPGKIDQAKLAASAKLLPVPPPPENIAKRLAAGFTPPASSLVVEEDGKVVAKAEAPVVIKQTSASEVELADYLRCLLGGKPFTKTFSFMGDNVKVVVRERTADEDEDVIRRTALTATSLGQRDNPVVITLLIMKYRIAYGITELRLGDDVRKFAKIPVGKMNETTKQYDIDQRVADLGDLPAALYAVLSVAVAEFSELTGDIAKRAADPKSWQTPPAV